MRGLAKFSHRVRFVMPVLLVAMFVSFCFIQGNISITFMAGVTDPLSSVLQKGNTVVMVYDNNDESNIDSNDIEKLYLYY